MKLSQKPRDEAMEKIENYIEKNIPKQLKEYKIIKKNEEKIGCVLKVKKDDGILLEEIYLEEPYRNKGIGSHIIKNIVKEKQNIYLWVYKENKRG